MPELEDKIESIFKLNPPAGRIVAKITSMIDEMTAAEMTPEDPQSVFKQCVIVTDTIDKETGDIIDTKYQIDVKGCADYLLSHYRIVTFKDNQESFIYDDGIYVPGIEPLIKGTVKKIIKDGQGPENIFKTSHVKEILLHIQAATFRDRREIEPPPCLINLNNGILDIDERLETPELLPHVAEYFFQSKLPVNYDAAADCPVFKKFLKEVMVESDIMALQEFFGYCLLREHRFHKAFMLIGEGANGKSTLLGVLKAMLGPENISSISIQAFDFDKFATARLYGKLANIYADLPDKALHSTGMFKMLTGGDAVDVQKKFKDQFSFTNHAKMIFSCNKLPEAKDDTAAFFRRWVIINFPHTFPPDKADAKLGQKMSAPEELSGVLNWALEGLKRLLKQGEFSGALSADAVCDLYQRLSNTLSAFLQDRIDESSSGTIGKEEFYVAYCEYCRAQNLPMKSKDAVSKGLPMLVAVESWRPKEGDKRPNSWKGIKFRDEPVVNPENPAPSQGQRRLGN